MPCELQGDSVRTRTRLKPACVLSEASSVPASHPASSLRRKPSPCLVVFQCFGHAAPIRQFCFSHTSNAVSGHTAPTRFLQRGKTKNKTFQEFQSSFQSSSSSSTMLLLTASPLLFLGKNQQLIFISLHIYIYLRALPVHIKGIQKERVVHTKGKQFLCHSTVWADEQN